jgi:hypothetical protein
LNWLRKIKEAGATVPVLDRMPSVLPHANWVWLAFWRLSATRQTNDQGPQPILLSEIKAYCDLAGVTEPAFQDDLLYHVMVLDRMFLDHAAKARAEADRKRRMSRGAARPSAARRKRR